MFFGAFVRSFTSSFSSFFSLQPDFGMDFRSPPDSRSKPARLIEQKEGNKRCESTRKSGVGEYECGKTDLLGEKCVGRVMYT